MVHALIHQMKSQTTTKNTQNTVNEHPHQKNKSNQDYNQFNQRIECENYRETLKKLKKIEFIPKIKISITQNAGRRLFSRGNHSGNTAR